MDDWQRGCSCSQADVRGGVGCVLDEQLVKLGVAVDVDAGSDG